jgi:thiosulfate/3-mercaptopyruvate sulfurtransferase
MPPVILDARPTRGATWPVGAHRADLERDLSAPSDPARGGRHPLPSLPDWLATLGRWGITPDTDVVVTDDQHGGLAAARCWWMLRAVGHTRVTVVPMEALGLPMTDVPSPTAPTAPYPDPGAWRWPTVDVEEVERRRTDPGWRVLDARAAERFRGEVEPLDPVAGHIPGAVNVPWGETTDLEVARERLQAALGDTPAERVLVHCGSGVTACHTLLQLDRLGMGAPALYVGSWSEWCRQGRPIGTGES